MSEWTPVGDEAWKIMQRIIDKMKEREVAESPPEAAE